MEDCFGPLRGLAVTGWCGADEDGGAFVYSILAVLAVESNNGEGELKRGAVVLGIASLGAG